MGFHFDTAALATAHLKANGWSQVRGNLWSKAGTDEDGPFDLRARVIPAGKEVVLVTVSEA